MVDALLSARRLLRPDGCLVDVHPTVESAHLEVGVDICTGDLHAEDARRRHAAADAALATIVARGIFAIEGVQEFSFRRYADSVEELWEYVAVKWTDAHFDDATLKRTRDALRTRLTASLWLREQVRVTTLGSSYLTRGHVRHHRTRDEDYGFLQGSHRAARRTPTARPH